jgi:recombination protein RecA
MMDENKKKALGAALMQIEKQFGKGSVMRMGDVAASRDIDVVSTGPQAWISHRLWWSARGRVMKFMVLNHRKDHINTASDCRMQKLGGTAAFVDAEHALDPGYAENRRYVDDLRFPSPIPVNRRWKLPTCWCVPDRSTWWWSIRLLR